MTPKQYINSRPHLNHSSICRSIGVDKAQFSRWLSGKGNIPLDKLKALESELRGYGYNGDKL
jgi:transcriptional regulator with XRE-family HTH domain